MVKRMRNSGVVWIGGLLLIILMVVSSCDTDIDINAENREVPIVYCVLDIADSVQFLKLNKTYLLEQAALENPPHRDSMYFVGNIDIVLERWEGNKPVEIITFYPSTDISKDDGFFPSDDNIVYKADTRILSNTVYHLNIYVEDKERILHSEITTVGKLLVIDPIDLPQRVVSLNTGINYTTRWKPVSNAGIYQVVVRFHYKEIIDGNIQDLNFEWPQSFTSPISNVDYLSKDISGARFYHILSDEIPVKNGLSRQVSDIDILILSGGMELKYYIESTAPADGALMERPVYTNIVNGLGIFSSVATKEVNGLSLASTTIDSIAYGQITKDLLFLDHKGLRNDDGE